MRQSIDGLNLEMQEPCQTTKSLSVDFTNPSRSAVRAASPANTRPIPSAQFDPSSATNQSNPGPASTRREPRSFNRETLSPDHGPRLLSEIGRWLKDADHLRY